MPISDIIVIVIVVIAVLLTLVFMVKKGIRPNSPMAKMLGRKNICKSKKCKVLLKKRNTSEYCEFHVVLESCMREYQEDIKRTNESELDFKKIKDGMELDATNITNKVRDRYTKNKLYKGRK